MIALFMRRVAHAELLAGIGVIDQEVTAKIHGLLRESRKFSFGCEREDVMPFLRSLKDAARDRRDRLKAAKIREKKGYR